jgi:hypothetical protein
MTTSIGRFQFQSHSRPGKLTQHFRGVISMRPALLLLLLLAPGCLLAHSDVSGRWTLTADIFHTPLHLPLELSQD